MIITKKQFRIWQFLVLISTSLLTTACNDNGNTNTFSKRTKQTDQRVEVVTVVKQAVNLTQTVSGTLEAVTKIRLYNEESGRITKLPYYEGDIVTKGQLLVQLDDAILKTDVAKAKANRQQKKVDFDRLKKLLAKKISTEEEVAQAETELDLAIAEENHQLTRFDRTSIEAPIDGLITKRFYEPGDLLAPQSHILTIIDPSSLRLKASIAERWIPLIDKGKEVQLRIDSLGDKRFDARIVRIHPTINISTHKGIIEILLHPVPENVKVGQFTRAEIELTSTERLIIPVHTIHFEPEGTFVYRIVEDEVDGMIAEKVFFVQGQQFGAVTEILSGLEAGDKIVSRGYLGLRQGKKVKVINTTAVSNEISPSPTEAEDGADIEPETIKD